MVHALERAGWVHARQRGSHAVMVHWGLGRTVPVPVHGSRDLPAGLMRSILRQVGLTVEEFLELLR
jgi:predicted RNA binding protein YcfA (HicA-like mRNA interferase family)